MVDISVVIPNLNSSIIDKVVNSLLGQSTDLTFEIIVVGQDNPRLIPENIKVRKIITQSVTPPGIARNLGVEISNGKLIMFLDADCIAMPDLLDSHWKAHFSEDIQNSSRLVCGSVLFPRRGYLQLCDNVATFHAYMPHLHEGPRRVLPTLNFSIETTDWNHLGGFDETYPFAAGEDADFVDRAKKSGMQAIFTPWPKVLHQHDRKNLKDLLLHAWRFGRYTKLFRGFRDKVGILFFRFFFLLCSPIVAAAIVGKILIKSRLPLCYWHTLPVVYLAKLAWCVGVASGTH
jgi:glycosyltransferase involved in cell wall biosynthesis